ncbi:MAG: shikimate dehydrogenase [Nitriliruptorales bacterium]
MTRWPSATTRLVAVIGWPVRHSLSPLMHNSAFREQGLDLVYLALPTPPEQLHTVVAALGACEAIGANVTVPHKREVMSACDRLTAEAELVGAVNTLVWSLEGLVGDNTDTLGLEVVLRDDLALPPGTPAAVLGTGGVARACAVALGRAGAPVTFIGRRLEAAEDIATLAASCGAPAAVALPLADTAAVVEAVAGARLVVNATPLGIAGEQLPAPFQSLHPGQAAFDLVYRPANTPFLAAARAAGADAHHGLGMLIAQAAASFRRWTGREAPTGTMSAVALAALQAEEQRRSP